ncbi:M4 family metallopeptidase [Lysobacter yangpyeongensis]
MAASRVDLHKQDAHRMEAQYNAVAARAGIAAKVADRHAEMLGFDAASGLKLLSTDTSNGTVRRYQQTHLGIPVFGESVVVAEDRNGHVRAMFGRRVDGLARELPSVVAKLDKGKALSIGKQAGLGNSLTTKRTENEKSDLMVWVDDNDRAHLVYVVSYFADNAKGGAPTRPFVIVDANNGRVLKKWEGLTHAAIGTGPGGNTKTGQYEWGSGGIYGYLDVAQSGSTCTMNNANVKSVNLNGGSSGTTAYSYTCPRNTYKTINGGYSPINDAHYFGGVITNMYPAYTGYNALSFQLVMRVHYGSSYENAFWDGSTMSFGDGASTFYPLVSADVAGHEVSHGFTEQHSNLTYSGMSGGMNEAFSDMGGEATEYYWKGTNDFLVGQEIFKGAAGQALRYMCNPTQDGGSIDNAADYNSGLDVHYSSGVYNKAFCNLAKTTGWGVPKAFKVMARANALYWTASSTFNQGACGVETAAQDLGFTVADVTAAFNTVGVSCSGGGGGGGGTTTALTKGVPVTGISASTGNSVNYKLDVPAGASNLVFTMSGGTGDADVYVKFGSAPTDTSYDCRPYKSGNAESCSFATPQAGTYYVRVKAYSSFSGVSLVGDYSTGGGGGGGTQTYSNTTDYSIPDNNATGISSPITVSGRSGNAPSTASISVNIVHTYSGDLKVDLIAPDGSVYNLRSYSGGSADNIVQTYTKNLSTEALNGTWKLRVIDNASLDTGYINSWSITF